jgi:flagellar biosynthetic protein FlhB
MADDNKTEQATPQRREKARKQGQVTRSRELPSLLAIIGVVAALWGVAETSLTHWTSFYRQVLDTAATTDMSSNGPLIFWTSVEALRWMVPVLLTALVVSVGSGMAQGGINIAPEAMELKFDRFNPASKLGQIFSLTGVNNLMKSLLPFSVMVWIAQSCISSHWGLMVRASGLGLRSLSAMLGGMMFEFAWKASIVLLVWAGVDYLLIWKKMEGDLKMSKEEIKEESKSTDGNPMIKARIRQLQRRMRKNRKQTLADAKTATVVITNPTHYAVALRYTPDMAAPQVVAKGMNLIAQEIKKLAYDSGIMVLENKPLARALYKTVEVGDAIPSALYQAVADILVIVFRAQAEVRRQEQMRRNRNALGQLVTQ